MANKGLTQKNIVSPIISMTINVLHEIWANKLVSPIEKISSCISYNYVENREILRSLFVRPLFALCSFYNINLALLQDFINQDHTYRDRIMCQHVVYRDI